MHGIFRAGDAGSECFDHGRKDDALNIATHAGEVYSYWGLDTMGALMERMEKFDEVEKPYANMAERYNDVGPILAAPRSHKPGYVGRAEKLTTMVFPDGLEKVTRDDFKDAPKDGGQVRTNSEQTKSAGINRGDVVVAFDGYRIRTEAQYQWDARRQKRS